jgi:ubiquinone/menaquinone biosynthesis C-methylase UbiE
VKPCPGDGQYFFYLKVVLYNQKGGFMNTENIKTLVKENYGKVAEKGGFAVSAKKASVRENMDRSMELGYSDQELDSIPTEANIGAGCGNPVALASIKKADTVVDLGSGAGIDCFLAAKRVGESGQVIGVDMTPEMIRKAAENATKGGFENVEFKLGEIEKIPLKDNFADVVISNCVVNLSSDKLEVFREAYRILKPGGRLFISDMVMNHTLPEQIIKSVAGYMGCISEAETKEQYLEYIKDAGFSDVKIISESFFDMDIITAFLDSLELETDEICGDEISSVKFAAIK